jgi:hypothetical protein
MLMVGDECRLDACMAHCMMCMCGCMHAWMGWPIAWLITCMHACMARCTSSPPPLRSSAMMPPAMPHAMLMPHGFCIKTPFESESSANDNYCSYTSQIWLYGSTWYWSSALEFLWFQPVLVVEERWKAWVGYLIASNRAH